MVVKHLALKRLLPAGAVIAVLGASLIASPGAIRNASAACSYGYLGAPTVTEISNNEGPLAGGTTVKVTGCGFTGTTGAGGVKFGGANALRYTFVNDSTIMAVSPAHAAAVVDVTVTAPSGTSAANPSDKFTFTGAAYCATYENLIRAPRTWVKGVAQTFTVTVSNCGTVTWAMTGTSRMNLNMHFTTRRGGILERSDWLLYGLFDITRKLPTNRSTIITVTLKPNFTSSGVWLEATMLRRSHYYFEQVTHHPTQWSAVFVTVS